MMLQKIVIRPEDMGIKAAKIDRMKIKAITWDDFRGKVPEDQWFLAHIYWHIEYSYDYVTEKNRLPKVTTRPTISSRSWKRDESCYYDLLRH